MFFPFPQLIKLFPIKFCHKNRLNHLVHTHDNQKIKNRVFRLVASRLW
jgi:hypothetical protein